MISRCRASIDKGISWLYDETKKYRGYFGSERKASSYLTAMILLRVHRLFFDRFPEVRALVVENLLRNNDGGTWVDERHTNAQFYERSRYPTTIRVLDLLTQIGHSSILDETVVQQGYQFLANEYRRDLSEPPDLALLLEALINIGGIDAIKSSLREEQLYDSWKGKPSLLNSEKEWAMSSSRKTEH